LRRIRTIIVGILAGTLALSATPAIAAWEDSASAAQRANALLDQMTIEEKIDMLHGESNFDYGFYNAPIERLGIPALTMADGPAGVRLANQEVNEGEATALPAPLALAATWNGNLAERYGRMAGREAFNTGHNVLLSPAADIFRDPHAGRGFEAFGEDPLLSGTMAARQIEGIQTNAVLANIKHLAAYNQEANRLIDGNAVVDERAYQEVYLRPVGMAVEQGHPASAMCSFNKINGTYACENEYLLTTVLREQMKFAGFVMSDYNATHTTLESLNAGLDQEQPSDYHFGQTLLDLVADGTVSEDTIDTSVLRILTPMFALGLFDTPVQTDGFNESANARVSQTVAEQAAVLLKNDDALPLNAQTLDSIAVIGTDADTDVAGGGSSLVKGTGSISPLEGIEDRVGAEVDVTYAPGTDPISNGGALLTGPEPVPSDVLTTNGGADAGLTARYWTNLTQDGEPGIDRIEPSATLYLGFPSYPNLNAQSPELPETPQTFTNDMSAEWTGTLTVPRTGEYTFSLGAEGSATLFVDGVAQLDVQDATTYEADTWTIALTAGDTHDVRIAYVHDTPTGTDGGPKLKFGWEPPRRFVAAQAQAAADLAADSDVAIVVVRDLATEGVDRPNLNLPQGQEALIRAVTRANPNTIVVLTTGGPVDVSSWSDDAAGILEAWYGGQRQGTAIARLLFGDVNPSGHLPVTFPYSEAETPTATAEQYPGEGLDAQYSEGIYVGYKGYAEQDIDARYPFGYGLSYTTWRSRVTELPTAVAVASDGLIAPNDLEVTARVRNTGTRDGSAVVQLYAGTLPGDIRTPERQLAGWARVSVDGGDVQVTTISLDPKSFATWDSEGDRWVTPRGSVELFLGTSVENATSVGSVVVG
jgi:beta-glucosidase